MRGERGKIITNITEIQKKNHKRILEQQIANKLDNVEKNV